MKRLSITSPPDHDSAARMLLMSPTMRRLTQNMLPGVAESPHAALARVGTGV